MSITVRCLSCTQSFTAPDGLRGRRVKCPACGGAINVPPPAPPPASAMGVVDELLAEEARPQQLPPQRSALSKDALGGGFIGFVVDHKLVLATIATSLALLAWNFGSWHVAPVAIAGFAGLGIGAGAWRSQWFGRAETRSAQDWRLAELWIGRAILLLLAAWPTYFVGLVVYGFCDAMFKGALKDGSTLILLAVLAPWAMFIGYCIFTHVLAQQFGFFKTAAWNFVVFWAVIAVLCVSLADTLGNLPAAWRSRLQLGAQGAPPKATFPGPPNLDLPTIARRDTPPGPGQSQPQPSPEHRANVPELKTPSKSGDRRDAQGSEPAAAVIKWTAQADPPAEPLPPGGASQPAILLANRSEVVLASGVSPLAAVGSRDSSESSVQIWNLSTARSIGKITGQIALRAPITISSDGKYVAGIGETGAIEIWSFESGRMASRLPLETGDDKPAIEFVAGPTLLVASSKGSGSRANVWTFEGVPEARAIQLPAASSVSALAISPGRRYLALCTGDELLLVNLNSGEICGTASAPRGRDRFGTEGAGLCFSGDGRELALFRETFGGGAQLVVWSMSDASVIRLCDVPTEPLVHRDFQRGRPIVCLPDRQGWLVGGRAIVDRQGRMWPIGLATTDSFFGEKLRILGVADRDHLIVASNQMLTTWALPRDSAGDIKLATMQIALAELPTGIISEDRFSAGRRDATASLPVGEAFENTSRAYRNSTQLEALCGDDAAFLGALHWYPAKKHPTLGIRFGVGVQINGQQSSEPLTSEELANLTRPIGPAVVKELQNRVDAGAFGDWPQLTDPRLRNVILVGVGPRGDLSAGAVRGGLDVVVIFELTAQASGFRRTITSLKVRLADLSGDPQWISPTLSSSQITGTQSDAAIVQEFVGVLMKQIDANYKLQAVPELKAEFVKRRIDRLASDKDRLGDLLNVFAELRYYRVKGLLTLDETSTAYRNWFNAETAKVMAEGDPQKRRTALEAWLKTAEVTSLTRKAQGN